MLPPLAQNTSTTPISEPPATTPDATGKVNSSASFGFRLLLLSKTRVRDDWSGTRELTGRSNGGEIQEAYAVPRIALPEANDLEIDGRGWHRVRCAHPQTCGSKRRYDSGISARDGLTFNDKSDLDLILFPFALLAMSRK